MESEKDVQPLNTMNKKGIVYYTDNRLEETIFSLVQKQLESTGLPIVSVSLKPINFGLNIVVAQEPCVKTMYDQILAGLKASTADTIFFCEHDVLYHASHFDFELPRSDIFYYNTNVWRWRYSRNYAITYDHLISQSGLCADRKFAENHYTERIEFIEKNGWRTKFGFEPGTKKIRRGGITDDDFSEWKSAQPNVDIRHMGSLTPLKCNLTSFVHSPPVDSWKKIRIDQVEGWNLRKMFNR